MYCSPSGTSAAARTSWPESPISLMGALQWGPERFTICWRAFRKPAGSWKQKRRGRKRSYLITAAGEQALADEYRRLQALSEDYRSYMGRRGEIEA